MEFQSLAPNLVKEPVMVLIQSRSVNIKIAGGGEPGLVIILFINFNEKITSLVGTIRRETSNIIEETV